MLTELRIRNFAIIESLTLPLGSGFNVLTGETGAGKTIFAQAIGLLLGAKGDEGLVGPAAAEAYVEAELESDALAELRPEDEDALLVARRVFADGRTRAYAWGRTAAREDVADAVEQVVALAVDLVDADLARVAA